MYVVPGMKLIPQTKNMSCWYASAQMLVNWKRQRLQMTLAKNPDPSEIRETVTWEVSNQGIVNPQVVRLANVLGLRTVPPMTPSGDYLESLLRQYGPLWTNGKTHVVVISGIDQTQNRLQVYDPSPIGAGKVDWRPYTWYSDGVSPSSRDTSKDVNAVFLYHP
jgi:ABC-type bacteriocin/lantibiotic exporter with double-glycine peptidase domain